MHVRGCAAFLTAGFAYQSSALLLRIAAFFLAPVGLLVSSFACSALDHALAIQAAQSGDAISFYCVFHVMCLELCTAQAFRTVTARILGYVEGSAALLGADVADEVSVFVRSMSFQNHN